MRNTITAAVLAVLAVGLFVMGPVGDTTKPSAQLPITEVNTFHELSVLADVLADLEAMKDANQINADRLDEIEELISVCGATETRYVSTTSTQDVALEMRVATLEAQVAELEKKCEDCGCDCPKPAAKAATPVPAPAASSTVSYGSTGSSTVSYGSTGSSTVSYGSTGSSVSYYYYPTTSSVVSYGSTGSSVVDPMAMSTQGMRYATSAQTYSPRWTHPGDIRSHMATGHGVDTSGKTTSQLYAEHDAIHEGGSTNVRYSNVSTSNCPGGICPTGTGGRVSVATGPVRRFFFGRR